MNRSSQLQHIVAHLGPQRALSLSWLVPLTALYVFIFILGVAGNLVTILVILKFRYMQTLTNLYLCNLAVTDLLTLLAGMPLELYTLWHQYPWQLGMAVCHMKSLVSETTAYGSVLTLVQFTLERYLAICGSTKAPVTNTALNTNASSRLKRIAFRNIIIIWFLSLLGATPLALFTQINYLYIDKAPLYESAWCGLPFNAPHRIWETIMLTSTILFFMIPLVIITLFYYLIARTLKKASRLDPFNNPDLHLADQRSSRKIIQSRKIVIRLLVAIVIAFAICWTPFHAQRLLFLYVSLYSQWSDDLRQINQILFLSAGIFYYLNSSVNPILYSVMSIRFRVAFSLYVNGCCSGPSNGQRNGSVPSNSNNLNKPSQNHSHSRSNNSKNSVIIHGGGNGAVLADVHFPRPANFVESLK